jgi:glutaconate CoA-transferase subunit B
VQLVGPALVPEHFACFGREYVMMPNHDKRNFVEKVDYISGVGHIGGTAGRRELGLKGFGPKYIYTPKCVFAFDDEGKIYVRSIHPGVTAEEVIESTGFELGDLSNVPTTPEPTDEELRILREEVDPNGLLLARPE